MNRLPSMSMFHRTFHFFFQPSPILIYSFSSFLRSIQRIAELEYSPNNGKSFSRICVNSYDISDDILNVRLQTLGVMEHSFPVHMAGRTYNWKLYDVGGAVSGLHLRILDYFSSFYLLAWAGTINFYCIYYL